MRNEMTTSTLAVMALIVMTVLLPSNAISSEKAGGIPVGASPVADTTPPKSFSLLSPKNGVTIWDDKVTVHWEKFARWYREHHVLFADFPTLEWERSSDKGSGLDHYEVWMDGKNVKNVPPENTKYSCMVEQRHHDWHIVAVDKAGNKRRSRDGFGFEYKLSRTPPMGFNTWSRFRGRIDEYLVKEMADAMVSSGMKDAGYQYVNLDDGWQAGSWLAVDPNKFPNGMKSLADYIHGKGLKFGIYARGVPDGLFDDMIDKFVSWGVDYLKYDSWCKFHVENNFDRVRELLKNCGRPIFYSISFKGHSPFVPAIEKCAGSYANSPSELPNAWRTGSDLHGGWPEVMRNIDQQVGLVDSHGLLHVAEWVYPGYWNDPDILEVGNRLTATESKSMFSLWCTLAAPLLAGNDLRKMNSTIRDILTNKEAIMVNQDPRGLTGNLVARDEDDSWQVWAKPLIPGPAYKRLKPLTPAPFQKRQKPQERQGYESRVAVVLLNRSDKDQDITVKWSDIGLPPKPAQVRDLWKHRNVGVFENSFTATVKPHDVVMVTIATVTPPKG